MSVVTIQAVSKQKIGLKIDDEWVGCSPMVGGFARVGSQYEIAARGPDGTITRITPAGGGGGYQKQGGYQKPAGGYQKQSGGYQKPTGDKKPWVDNSLGQSVGAAMNNAVALFIAGKIQEAQIPKAAVSLFLAAEAIKEAGAEKAGTSVGEDFVLVPTSQQKSAPAQSQSQSSNFDMDSDDCPFDN